MLNQICIAGNLGQDPEVRYTQTGLAIANLNVAVNEHHKDGNGERQKRTHWFRATSFGRTAEIAAEYLRKGSKVGIAGQLVQRSWQDQNGNNRHSVEIRITQLEFMGTANGNSHGATGDNTQPETNRQEPPPAGKASARSAPPRQQRFNDTYEPPPDADIPF